MSLVTLSSIVSNRNATTRVHNFMNQDDDDVQHPSSTDKQNIIEESTGIAIAINAGSGIPTRKRPLDSSTSGLQLSRVAGVITSTPAIVPQKQNCHRHFPQTRHRERLKRPYNSIGSVPSKVNDNAIDISPTLRITSVAATIPHSTAILAPTIGDATLKAPHPQLISSLQVETQAQLRIQPHRSNPCKILDSTATSAIASTSQQTAETYAQALRSIVSTSVAASAIYKITNMQQQNNKTVDTTNTASSSRTGTAISVPTKTRPSASTSCPAHNVMQPKGPYPQASMATSNNAATASITNQQQHEHLGNHCLLTNKTMVVKLPRAPATVPTFSNNNPISILAMADVVQRHENALQQILSNVVSANNITNRINNKNITTAAAKSTASPTTIGTNFKPTAADISTTTAMRDSKNVVPDEINVRTVRGGDECNGTKTITEAAATTMEACTQNNGNTMNLSNNHDITTSNSSQQQKERKRRPTAFDNENSNTYATKMSTKSDDGDNASSTSGVSNNTDGSPSSLSGDDNDNYNASSNKQR